MELVIPGWKPAELEVELLKLGFRSGWEVHYAIKSNEKIEKVF